MIGDYEIDLVRQGGPASDAELAFVEREIQCSLPTDLRLLLERCNGLEGFISESDDVYLSVWSSGAIARDSKRYLLSHVGPGLVIFGSDGSDTALAFRWRGGQADYVLASFTDGSDAALHSCGSTLEALVAQLVSRP